MRLAEIEPGMNVGVGWEVKTDRPQYAIGIKFADTGCKVGVYLGRRTAPDPVQPHSYAEATVEAVRVPYRNGMHGVELSATRYSYHTCQCAQCGDRHLPDDQDWEVQTEAVSFTVHYSQIGGTWIDCEVDNATSRFEADERSRYRQDRLSRGLSIRLMGSRRT